MNKIPVFIVDVFSHLYLVDKKKLTDFSSLLLDAYGYVIVVDIV